MKILVTGAAGYIGGFLTEKLLSSDNEVIAVDRYTRNKPEEIFGKQRRQLTCIKVDLIKNPEKLDTVKTKVDVVFHLAGRNNTPDANVFPEIFHKGNVTATVNLLEWSRKNGIGKFIYAASASCYGTPSVLPTPETYPADPQYIYALTKYLGESAVLHWSSVYRLPVVSLRLFSVYGPRTRSGLGSGLFISKFLDAVREKRAIAINGDGTQSRDMVYISDVVSAFTVAAKVRTAHGIYNVGSGKSISLNHIISLLGYSNVSYQNRPKGEADTTKADISKIQKELNWKPLVSIEEGIDMTIRNDKGK